MTTRISMKIPWHIFLFILLVAFSGIDICQSQDTEDYDDGNANEEGAASGPAPPPEMEDCNGIFISYELEDTLKAFPRVKNKTDQAYAFNSEVQIVNVGKEAIKGWKLFIGFQHRELLVSATGAQLTGSDGFPADVSDGAMLQGSTDLKTAIDTAFDLNQMSAKVKLKGTVFGVSEKSKPLPDKLKLENDGWRCPAPTERDGGGSMYVCCKRDPKYKAKSKKIKYSDRVTGDLVFTYDVLQAYPNNYLAQVTIDNRNPLGRLDKWNLTFEWQRGEFIQTLRGAYSRRRDVHQCIYGPISQAYGDMDFSQVASCERKPIISDLPPERYNDTKIGLIPHCCRNGTVLPSIMDPGQSKSVFQMQVFKLPTDSNRTAITPPLNWKITGVLQPQYSCSPPARVTPTEMPDPSGLPSVSVAVGTWEVVCNITKPKPKRAKCCVSFSAFWNSSSIPCNTCACGGCEEDGKCDPNARAMLVPPQALLLPFLNRTKMIKAWAEHLKRKVPKKLPCPDNCGVSINWHVDSDTSTGWSARMTIFNWGRTAFQDWFAAITVPKAYPGYENVYSFNGTKLNKEKSVLFQGLEGMETLSPIEKGRPAVPGKQQSVISFKKNHRTRGINIAKGDGFPKKIFFNGEECALPAAIPKSAASQMNPSAFIKIIFLGLVSFFVMENHHHLH